MEASPVCAIPEPDWDGAETDGDGAVAGDDGVTAGDDDVTAGDDGVTAGDDGVTGEDDAAKFDVDGAAEPVSLEPPQAGAEANSTMAAPRMTRRIGMGLVVNDMSAYTSRSLWLDRACGISPIVGSA